MATEFAMERGDLFGALIVRKLNPDSTLYNAASMFGLSLPALDEAPRDIFNLVVKSEPPPETLTIREFKEQGVDAGAAHFFGGPEPPKHEHKYLSLLPKETRLPMSLPALRSDTPESFVSNVSLLAMKGVASEFFRVDRKPPLVSITGRSTMAVQHFLVNVRALFLIRTLLNSACEAFINHSADATGLALGGQLVELLHVLDASLAGLHEAPRLSICTGASPEEGMLNSLVVMWERTQLHRMFLVHLFATVRPTGPGLTLADLGAFVLTDETENTFSEKGKVIAQLLHSDAWVRSTGWSLFHRLLGAFNLTRESTWMIHSAPVFEQCLFRNATDFALDSQKDKANIGLDFGRMIITGAVVRRASVPLLLELKAKLFDLDAEFFVEDAVQSAELQSSLLISIDALWRSFTDSDPDSGDGAYEGEGESRSTGSRRSEQCVEFLLAALAWARGRVQLMLLAPNADAADTDRCCTTLLGTDAARGSKSRYKAGSLQVRDRIAVYPSQEAVQNGSPFNRQAVIDAFRAINPQLVLPLNERDEELMTLVKGKSLALQAHMQVEVAQKLRQWNLSFATLSDYYNEHAVSAKSLFTRLDFPMRGRPTSTPIPFSGDLPGGEERVSLARRRLEKRAAEDAAADVPTVEDPHTQTYLTGPLGAPRTVPTALVEAAKDHIRAKYVSLMKEVDAKGSAAAWSNKRHEALPQARADLSRLFEQDAAELDRLRALKQRDADTYQRHFEDQLGVTPTSPLQLAPLVPELSFEVYGKLAIVTEVGRVGNYEDDIALPKSVPLQASPAEVDPGASQSSTVKDAESAARARVTVFEDERDNIEEDVCVLENVDEAHSVDEKQKQGAPGTEDVMAPRAMSEASASHSLVDLAPFLLGRSAGQTGAAGADAYEDIQSLAQSILLLASAHGLVTCCAEDLADELAAMQREHAGASPSGLQEALLQRVARPVSNLHSLCSVLMRSLGRTVLTQCRAINLASLHCLINSSVDLLGHVQAVDNLLLVSPNSDFLVSLCTHMVDQHQQNIRVLHRHGSAEVAALSPQLRNPTNATLWSDEALQIGFTSVLASASAANQWKEYGTLFASMHTNVDAVSAPDSVGGVTMRWSTGLFSSAPLASLVVKYEAPWPVAAIITDDVLARFTAITRRFLEVGQLVALFRVVWADLRTRRVVTTRNKPAGSAHPPQVDRHISDSMRLVQQTVQHLFDYLSERVYVHQARFKKVMRRASSHGLDAVVNALNAYSEGLYDAALQLTAEEEVWLAQRTTAPESLPDPSLELKTNINRMLDCCRRVLSVSKALSETSANETDSGNVEGMVHVLQESSFQIQLYRKSLVAAAKKIATNGKANLDLQPLIMRFEESSLQ